MNPRFEAPLQLLRRILRSTRGSLHEKGVTTRSPFHLYLMAEFRASECLPVDDARKLRMFAADYCSMKMDLDERSRLHRLDTGAEEQLSPKELDRKSVV